MSVSYEIMDDVGSRDNKEDYLLLVHLLKHILKGSLGSKMFISPVYLRRERKLNWRGEKLKCDMNPVNPPST
jgi:hypothetical protein